MAIYKLKVWNLLISGTYVGKTTCVHCVHVKHPVNLLMINKYIRTNVPTYVCTYISEDRV